MLTAASRRALTPVAPKLTETALRAVPGIAAGIALRLAPVSLATRTARPSALRLPVVAAASAAIVFAAAPAHATSDEGLVETLAVIFLEPVVPDSRVEFDGSEVYANLSWPLPHLDAYRLVGSRVDSTDEFWPSVFVEPQWRPEDGQFRFLGGSRLRFDSVPLFLEGAGLLGSDGNGGTFGLGAALLQEKSHGLLSVVYRHTWTNEGERDDVGFDLLFYVL